MCHSNGAALTTVALLQEPALFHSVLTLSGAIGPGVGFLEDYTDGYQLQFNMLALRRSVLFTYVLLVCWCRWCWCSCCWLLTLRYASSGTPASTASCRGKGQGVERRRGRQAVRGGWSGAGRR